MSLAMVFSVALGAASAQNAADRSKDAPRPAYVRQPAVDRAVKRSAPKATPGLTADKPRYVARDRPRQDGDSVAERKRTVWRLKHVPAHDVADTVRELIATELRAEQAVILADAVTNSVIICASPRIFDEIKEIVEELDRQPRTVILQLLIVEMTQNTVIEKGLAADTDRSSILGLSDKSAFTADGLRSELGLTADGRSASHKEVAARVSALEKRGRVRVISRPQITTLDNQPAFLQIGQREPVIFGAQRSGSSRISQFRYENVGLKVAVTPRVNSDRLVTVEIDVEQSRVAAGDTAAVSASNEGDVVHAPRVVTTALQTTVSVADGKAIVLGGVTTKSDSRQTELLIILTARIVDAGQ